MTFLKQCADQMSIDEIIQADQSGNEGGTLWIFDSCLRKEDRSRCCLVLNLGKMGRRRFDIAMMISRSPVRRINDRALILSNMLLAA